VSVGPGDDLKDLPEGAPAGAALSGGDHRGVEPIRRLPEGLLRRAAHDGDSETGEGVEGERKVVWYLSRYG